MTLAEAATLYVDRKGFARLRLTPWNDGAYLRVYVLPNGLLGPWLTLYDLSSQGPRDPDRIMILEVPQTFAADQGWLPYSGELDPRERLPSPLTEVAQTLAAWQRMLMNLDASIEGERATKPFLDMREELLVQVLQARQDVDAAASDPEARGTAYRRQLVAEEALRTLRHLHHLRLLPKSEIALACDCGNQDTTAPPITALPPCSAGCGRKMFVVGAQLI